MKMIPFDKYNDRHFFISLNKVSRIKYATLHLPNHKKFLSHKILTEVFGSFLGFFIDNFFILSRQYIYMTEVIYLLTLTLKVL